MHRLTTAAVACWVLKTTLAPARIEPGWLPGTPRELSRCVRPTYRLGLMAVGQPCLLWLSGRVRPGVHALGELTGPPGPSPGGTVVPVRLTPLPEPVDRADLLADPVVRDAEVLRMPAGSNPSWLSRPQFDGVLARVQDPALLAGLGPWLP